MPLLYTCWQNFHHGKSTLTNPNINSDLKDQEQVYLIYLQRQTWAICPESWAAWLFLLWNAFIWYMSISYNAIYTAGLLSLTKHPLKQYSTFAWNFIHLKRGNGMRRKVISSQKKLLQGNLHFKNQQDCILKYILFLTIKNYFYQEWHSANQMSTLSPCLVCCFSMFNNSLNKNI